MSYIDDFINSVKDGAIASMKAYGVLASITIAQAILESSWGNSTLAKESKNLFGVKAIGGWRGEKKSYATYEYYNGKKTLINDYFRVYNSFAESIDDHALFLVNNSRYNQHGFFSAKDYVGQANALQKAGYATAPDYAKQLINLIKQYSLNKYDIIKSNSFIKVDGEAYASYKEGSPGINLIIRDYSQDIVRCFAWVDNDKGASWAFDLVPPNLNYTVLKKNTSKVITTRNGGYTFSKGANYKIKVKGYNKDRKIVAENEIVLRVPK
ncbi:glycoside hydrolase family 73 protein [Clostridium peptidivorans]|uniref:glycoside hydrolase family 73 protein n=1 Tax=Clostridium peptidivorans TaxID=100174 RepID=UPI000BE2C368|nr:glucosaminidase domain-containing protein [Clostridium peptidivorans]